jgi:hypothetical protein
MLYLLIVKNIELNRKQVAMFIKNVIFACVLLGSALASKAMKVREMHIDTYETPSSKELSSNICQLHRQYSDGNETTSSPVILRKPSENKQFIITELQTKIGELEKECTSDPKTNCVHIPLFAKTILNFEHFKYEKPKNKKYQILINPPSPYKPLDCHNELIQNIPSQELIKGYKDLFIATSKSMLETIQQAMPEPYPSKIEPLHNVVLPSKDTCNYLDLDDKYYTDQFLFAQGVYEYDGDHIKRCKDSFENNIKSALRKITNLNTMITSSDGIFKNYHRSRNAYSGWKKCCLASGLAFMAGIVWSSLSRNMYSKIFAGLGGLALFATCAGTIKTRRSANNAFALAKKDKTYQSRLKDYTEQRNRIINGGASRARLQTMIPDTHDLGTEDTKFYAFLKETPSRTYEDIKITK